MYDGGAQKSMSDGHVIRRASPPVRSKKGDKKRHVEQAAREKIAAMGGTFISYNRKSRVCHYLTKTGQKVAKSVYLG